MNGYTTTLLSADDHDRLQGVLCTMIGGRSPFARLVRQKLAAAAIVPDEELGPDLVTSGRRIRFSVNGRPSQERTLLWAPPVKGNRRHLSLHSPRGLALLGLRAGESISYITDGRRTEFLEVEEVFDEDEAAVPMVTEPSVPGGGTGLIEAELPALA